MRLSFSSSQRTQIFTLYVIRFLRFSSREYWIHSRSVTGATNLCDVTDRFLGFLTLCFYLCISRWLELFCSLTVHLRRLSARLRWRDGRVGVNEWARGGAGESTDRRRGTTIQPLSKSLIFFHSLLMLFLEFFFFFDLSFQITGLL